MGGAGRRRMGVVEKPLNPSKWCDSMWSVWDVGNRQPR